VLVRGLARTPAERFPHAGAMADALSGIGTPEAAAQARPAVPIPVAIVPPPTYARSTPAAGPPPAAGEQTRIYAPAMFTPQPAAAPPRAQPAAAPAYAPQWQGAPPPQLHPAPPQTRPSAFRRFLRAAWEFTLTSISVALFVGSWALSIYYVSEGRPRRLMAALALTVLFTPLAVHRLASRRGRYGFGVFGALVATVLAWRVVGRAGDPAIAVAAVFGLQVLACFLMSWLTRRRTPEPQPYDAPPLRP
jgi:hypothetical protein